MADNALALIQAKIVQLEEKLNDLKSTEKELRKLSGASARRTMSAPPTKRSKITSDVAAPADGPTSTIGTIRAFLGDNGPSSARAIRGATGLEGRAISFTLQALKRQGEVKMKDGEWSLKGRRKAS